MPVSVLTHSSKRYVYLSPIRAGHTYAEKLAEGPAPNLQVEMSPVECPR